MPELVDHGRLARAAAERRAPPMSLLNRLAYETCAGRRTRCACGSFRIYVGTHGRDAGRALIVRGLDEMEAGRG